VLMPLACQPVQIAGRNRIWRKMVIDGIRQLSAVPSALNRPFRLPSP
jgi:hypothetical protein